MTNLKLSPISGQKKSSIFNGLFKRKYVILDNDLNVKTITFNLEDRQSSVEIEIDRGTEILKIGFEQYEKSKTKSHLPNDSIKSIASSGAWIGSNEYQIRIYDCESPASITYTFRFKNDGLEWQSNLENSLFWSRKQIQFLGTLIK